MPSHFLSRLDDQQPLFGGRPSLPPNLLNFGNLPGMEGPGGAMLQMAMMPLYQQAFGDQAIPAQFMPTMSFYEQQRRLQNMVEQRRAMAAGANADRDFYMRTMRNMAAAAGVPMNARRDQAIATMAGDMTGLMQQLGPMAPELFDSLHGSRGSGQIMAQQLFAGGRFALDPVTRRPGVSGDTMEFMSGRLREMMYGPGADRADLRPAFGAGQSGSLYAEMQRRGLGQAPLSREQQRREIVPDLARERGRAGAVGAAGALAAAGAEFDLGGPDIDRRIRELETGRVARKLKEMSGAVQAMREIFGDMGRPNAPMAELVEGLNMLTQGGMSKYSPQKLEQMVRDTANIARRSGMGVDNMTQFVAGATASADRQGIDRFFALRAGQHGAAFGHAYGLTTGGTPMWGRLGKDEMSLIDRQLTTNAAGSSTANQLSATMRLMSQYGFAEGSEAEKIANAIKEGKTEYAPGQSVFVPQSRWADVMTAGLKAPGRTQEEIRRWVTNTRMQRAGNEPFGAEFDTAGLTRELQARHSAIPRAQRVFEQAFAQNLPANMQGDVKRYAGDIVRGMLGMEDGDYQNADKVLKAAGLNNLPADVQARLKEAIPHAWGALGETVRTSPSLRGFKSAAGFMDAFNQKTMKEKRRQEEEAKVETKIQTALSGIGTAGPLARLVDALGEMEKGDDFKSVFRKVMGFAATDEVAKALEKPTQELTEEIYRYQNAEKIASTLPGVDAADVRKEALKKIYQGVKQVRAEGERLGFADAPRITAGQARSASAGIRDRAAGSLQDIDDMADAVLGDAATARLTAGDIGPDGKLTGEAGTAIAATIKETSRKLRELGDQHGGGDYRTLLATPEQRAEAKKLYREEQTAAEDGRRFAAMQKGLENGSLDRGAFHKKIKEMLAQAEPGSARAKELAAALSEADPAKAAANLAQSSDARYRTAGKSLDDIKTYDARKLGRLGDIDPVAAANAKRWQMQQERSAEILRTRLQAGLDPYKFMRQKPQEELDALYEKHKLDPSKKEEFEAKLKTLPPEIQAQIKERREKIESIDKLEKGGEEQRKALGGFLTEKKDKDVAEGLAKAYGLDADAKRELLESGVLGRDKASGRAGRSVWFALEKLQEKAKKAGIGFSDYLKKGPGEDDDSKALFSLLPPDLRDFKGTGRELAERFKKLGSAFDPSKPPAGGAGAGGPAGVTRIEITSGDLVLKDNRTCQITGGRGGAVGT